MFVSYELHIVAARRDGQEWTKQTIWVLFQIQKSIGNKAYAEDSLISY